MNLGLGANLAGGIIATLSLEDGLEDGVSLNWTI